MGMIETWMGVLTKPVETFATEKKNSSIMAGVKQYAIIFGIFGLLMGIEVAAMAYIMSFFPPAGNLSFIRSLGIAAIIVVPIIFIVIVDVNKRQLVFAFKIGQIWNIYVTYNLTVFN